MTVLRSQPFFEPGTRRLGSVRAVAHADGDLEFDGRIVLSVGSAGREVTLEMACLAEDSFGDLYHLLAESGPLQLTQGTAIDIRLEHFELVHADRAILFLHAER